MRARKNRAKGGDSSRRERRAFTEEFKQEAVRLMHERRAKGATVTQVGRELDVRPDQLREWARRLAAREGGLAAAGVVETPEQELQRLRRENARLKEAEAFAKKIAVYFAKESR
jgi:transposase-like protein